MSHSAGWFLQHKPGYDHLLLPARTLCLPAGTAPSTYATACNTTLYSKCQGQQNCTFGNCIPQSMQFACVEPSHFAVRAPQYEILLFGDAVAGSTGYATTLTCPSASTQVSHLAHKQ